MADVRFSSRNLTMCGHWWRSQTCQSTKSLRDSPLRGGVTGRTVIVDRTSSLLRQNSDPSSTGRAAAREIGMLRQHCPRMTNPGAIGEADHLDEQIANSFGSKESSSLKSSRVPAPMPPEGCPEPHHAEVVACDLFATPNSLSHSRASRKLSTLPRRAAPKGGERPWERDA